MSYIKKIPNSLKELLNVYSLAAIAMLLALRVVLGFFANATLPLFSNTIKISGAFLPIAVAGSMFGPIPAALVGALGDIISFIIAPTGGGFFPGFTISGFLTGMIFGIVLYKNKISLVRVIIAWAANMLLVETFLNAYWLFILYGGETPYLVYLSARFISVAVKCIPEIILLLAVTKLASKIKIPRTLRKKV